MGGLVRYTLPDGTPVELPPEFLSYPGGPLARVRDIMNERYDVDIAILSKQGRSFLRKMKEGWDPTLAAKEVGLYYEHPVLQLLLDLPANQKIDTYSIAAKHVRGEMVREEEIERVRAAHPPTVQLHHQGLSQYYPPAEVDPAILRGVRAAERVRPLAPDWEPRLGRGRPDPEESPVAVQDDVDDVDVEEEEMPAKTVIRCEDCGETMLASELAEHDRERHPDSLATVLLPPKTNHMPTFTAPAVVTIDLPGGPGEFVQEYQVVGKPVDELRAKAVKRGIRAQANIPLGDREPLDMTEMPSGDGAVEEVTIEPDLPTDEPGPLPEQEEEQIRSCRECGCTDDQACEEVCWWVEDDLCSTCDRKVSDDDQVEEPAVPTDVAVEKTEEVPVEPAPQVVHIDDIADQILGSIETSRAEAAEHKRWMRQELKGYLDLVKAGYSLDTSPHFRWLTPAQLEEVRKRAI